LKTQDFDYPIRNLDGLDRLDGLDYDSWRWSR